MIELRVTGEAEQEALGRRLALNCRAPCIVYLVGDLGAGKTTLTRGFLRGIGYQGRVKSPTYTLLEPYELGSISCYHFDLYRLADAEELAYLGIQDLLTDDAVMLIEWPEKGQGGLPAADLLVKIEHDGLSRQVTIEGASDRGSEIIQEIQSDLVDG
ncbi:MAG: tRNA (adenosine(37)-N6)-threonylcarbamoyltransferase complex ATPase subunit type 1 TsaE [Candidatus Thiodiazotropha taylori]|uniref:tRNA threonylcarbamoyladenosine biosynthesis protein TsaE n=1 Tax=Candidatus Thiodiazotropha taylori TaxID=2792791 RepID=A0A9E4KB80_9GAMM|nr:tRNA (adenosine(37)-N6)-threonylcarbamoyltransferase complex ATPase subunit type 1 TsaE [Candidatus Thiodiazotropha taylori]RLW71824.1 MAG: tRNA (adenosine(37)-N6)-threonylcarbamoyltransferase complex ATPase subunit type 1 TsaE [gamma proteobacterium symbiont of Stewartia floridana]MCG7956277.1 tRNA (adenosine(37)-N6)-threonylcarbamoyltransferase complex ATPase subunit type 1 TsaE [Candidatus Thiodiazotropha taylori]MCG7966883.1 tRNA (adenosine(37)-N6)-threonylcarbamoyltransferase complex ATP